ncbi:hypothetical protein LBMAG53_19110 [Planctomycetota bacterium]|nr:hypothetical protein LBMAG53_19110 [Planctomycetota bacterium]
MHLRTAVPTIAAIAALLSGCSGGGGGGGSQAEVVETIGTNSPRMMASAVAGTSLLVAQLKCDELNVTQGTTPNNVASLPGRAQGAKLVAGVERGALALEPSSLVTVNPGSSAALVAANDDSSFSLWVRIEALSGAGTVLTVTSTHGGLRLDVAAAGLTLIANGLDGEDLPLTLNHALPASISDGAWHHLALTTHGGDAAVAVDGAVLADGLDLPTLGAVGQVTAGGGLTGAIDDLRVYRTALSTSELQALSHLERGMVGWWQFDEGTGTAVSDSSGYGNHAVFTNGSWTAGIADTCGSFDGLKSKVVVTGGETLALGGRISVSAWVRLADSSRDEYLRIVSKKTYWNQPDGFELEYNPVQKYLSMTAGDNNYARAENIDLGREWHHVAAAIDGSVARIFVDGVDVTTDSSAGAIKQGSAPLIIGQAADPTLADYTTWNGQIDDVRIHDYTLTATEVGVLAKAKERFRDPQPFAWVRKLYNEIDPKPEAIAASMDVERVEKISGDLAGGSLRLRQWSGDNRAGSRSFGGNSLIAATGDQFAFTLESFDIVRGTLTSGKYTWARRTAQDARLRIGFAAEAIPTGAHGQFLVLGGSVLDAEQIVLSLPVRWVPPGRTGSWQTGDYNGVPEETGIWFVAKGKSLAEAQADEANRVGDLDDLLATEAPTSGKWTFDFRAVTGSWTLRVDKNRDGVFETVRTGSHPATLPANPRQMLGIEPAGGSGAGQVTLSDFTIGYTLIPASAAN